MPYHLHALGDKPILLCNGNVVFTQPQPLMLLSYLLLEPQTKRSQIANLFWEHLAPQKRTDNLRKCLSALRKVPHELIQETDNQLSTQIASDLTELEEAIAQEDGERVINLYKGELLRGIEYVLNLANRPLLEEWLMDKREEFQSLAFEQIVRLAERRVALGNYQEASDLALKAEKIVSNHGFLVPDDFNRLHTLLLAGNSNHTARLERKALEIYQSEDGLSLCKDKLTAQKRLEQPHNLPPSSAIFIGRKAELAEIVTWALYGKGHLLNIVGMPGTGKSELALEAARNRLLGSKVFEDGIYFIELENLKSTSDIPLAIAETLKIKLTTQNKAKELIRILQQRSLLLLLDNYEHLSGDGLLLEQLANCPNVKIILTSRKRLEAEWEVVLPLEGLSYPSPETELSIKQTKDYSAITLFLRKAKLSAPDFKISRENLLPIANITRLVEGNPLALCLAATWMYSTSAKAVAEAIEQDIDFLANNAKALKKSHHSLEATFSLSWKLLAEDLRNAYCKLSVFIGSFDFKAARYLGVSLLALRQLIKASLLKYFADLQRYSFHPLLHQFAQKKLAEKEQLRWVHEVHARYYLAELYKVTNGSQEEKNEAPKKLTPDIRNILQAWQVTSKRAWAEEIARCSQALGILFDMLTLYQQGIEAFELSIKALYNSVERHPVALGNAIALQAWLFKQSANYKKAIELAKKALRLTEPLVYEECIAQEGMLAALNCLGASYDQLGLFNEAKQYYQRLLMDSKGLRY